MGGHMEDFSVIYKILSALHKSMDCDEFDMDLISPERLGISRNRWMQIIRMLSDRGYVEDLVVRIGADGGFSFGCGPRPRLTLDGLEYLEENSLMKRAYRLAKGIKDVVPGM